MTAESPRLPAGTGRVLEAGPGYHRSIPRPPPPPTFLPRPVRRPAATNEDVLWALASLSADVKAMCEELDHYGFQCTDYVFRLMQAALDQGDRSRVKATRDAWDQLAKDVPGWDLARRDLIERVYHRGRDRRAPSMRMGQYEASHGAFGFGRAHPNASNEDVLRMIAELSAYLPAYFERLVLVRRRCMSRLHEAFREIA